MRKQLDMINQEVNARAAANSAEFGIGGLATCGPPPQPAPGSRVEQEIAAVAQSLEGLEKVVTILHQRCESALVPAGPKCENLDKQGQNIDVASRFVLALRGINGSIQEQTLRIVQLTQRLET